ncbi:MAG: hypothetical protein D6719_10350 [Candidatus Dadabacteria bacterium]|nr:MAG: hypothetical protein D6719_10350 [Candidatus Dadabacteria bacterium]
MATIQIKQNTAENGWKFDVTVDDGRGSSKHSVTLSKALYDKLTAGDITPEDLIRKSFNFLLEREPKESILSSFDLSVISRYFPEYERVIKNEICKR